MNEVSKVEAYSKDMQNCIAIMSQTTYDSVSNNLDVLENDILDYLHHKFPNMSVSKNELHDIIIKIYQTKNYNLQKEVECNLGKAKFAFEDKNGDTTKIILEEIEKLRKLFTSVKSGTNYYYLGLVDKSTQEIIGWLIRWHNSISFSKESENAKNHIRSLIENNYKVIMNEMGERLLTSIVEPLENNYPANNKVIVKQ